MADQVEVAAGGEGQKAGGGRQRRRGPDGRRRRGPPRDGAGGGAAAEGEARAPRERGPSRAATACPVPAAFLGTTKEGKICDIIKKGQEKFGFIYIGDGTTAHEETPRIYFNFKDFEDADYVPRKGYSVAFKCLNDDKGRAYASALTLTEEGKTQAAEREALIKSTAREPRAAGEPRAPREKKEKAEGGAGGEARPKRERKPRAVDERTVQLKVTCVGKGSEEKELTARLGESIGRIKHAATQAFDAPIHLNVFCKGELLTKTILAGLSDGDVIHLGEPVASSA